MGNDDNPTREEMLRGYLAEVIAGIIRDKEAGNIRPLCAELPEVTRRAAEEVKAALNGMCRDKILTYNRTLNGVAFTPSR